MISGRPKTPEPDEQEQTVRALDEIADGHVFFLPELDRKNLPDEAPAPRPADD